jgi:hypothetical protein
MPSRSHAIPILQLFALTVMIIPSDTVIQVIGASGYPASLVGLFGFAAFVAATLLGFHNPLRRPHPVRTALCLLWLSVLVSYVLMDRGQMSLTQTASADRWILQLAAITGVALIAAECLTSLGDVRRVLRALTWGGAFCGVIAALQFWMALDLAPFLRELPGFSLNFDNPGIVNRAAFNRAAGTAIHPIELGVVAGMLLPLAIHLAIWDKERSPRNRWAPVVLIGLAIPASVSRSAILALAVALGVLIALMPSRQRLFALSAVPFAIAAVFMTAPGLIGTLRSFFAAGTSDPSIGTRVDDYPLVERMVQQAPWFGQGGNTYTFDNMIDILDNQYLKTAIEQGLFGVVALAAFFLVPVGAALIARRHTRDPELQLLCAALAGAGLAATICSFTFDSLSFPMFANVHALVIGTVGACWLLVRAEAGVGARASASTFAPTMTRAVLPAGG